MLTYFLLWLPMLLIAVINGTLRELLIKKYTTELTAYQLSTVLLLFFFALYIGFVLKRFPPRSSQQALLIGVLWLALTLLFEFGFGRWRGNSWPSLLADYNLAKGRLWLFVPLWVTVAPYFFYTHWKH